ncbi:MAG TPA: hypothetical protein PKK48_07640 [Phycisphaerae bacterium]|nr:hypothetical protein [Phycisphaerae bacterium]
MGLQIRQMGILRLGVLAVLFMAAGALLTGLFVSMDNAVAQTPAVGAGNNGVYIVAGQISSNTYGLYLVDYENQTICVYQYSPGDRKLRLMSARTYRFDVNLDEFNTSDPTPREVRDLVGRQHRLAMPADNVEK